MVAFVLYTQQPLIRFWVSAFQKKNIYIYILLISPRDLLIYYLYFESEQSIKTSLTVDLTYPMERATDDEVTIRRNEGTAKVSHKSKLVCK